MWVFASLDPVSRHQWSCKDPSDTACRAVFESSDPKHGFCGLDRSQWNWSIEGGWQRDMRCMACPHQAQLHESLLVCSSFPGQVSGVADCRVIRGLLRRSLACSIDGSVASTCNSVGTPSNNSPCCCLCLYCPQRQWLLTLTWCARTLGRYSLSTLPCSLGASLGLGFLVSAELCLWLGWDLSQLHTIG